MNRDSSSRFDDFQFSHRLRIIQIYPKNLKGLMRVAKRRQVVLEARKWRDFRDLWRATFRNASRRKRSGVNNIVETVEKRLKSRFYWDIERSCNDRQVSNNSSLRFALKLDIAWGFFSPWKTGCSYSIVFYLIWANGDSVESKI